MKKPTITAACLGLFCLGQVTSAEDMSVNRLLASQCAQCHGTNGHAVGDMDGLADESFKDLYEDLMDMRSEDRPEDIMDHQALGYSDDQIRRIAAYYGMRAGKDDERPEGGGDSGEQAGSGDESEKQAGERRRESEKKSREKQRERLKERKERKNDSGRGKENKNRKEKKEEKDDD